MSRVTGSTLNSLGSSQRFIHSDYEYPRFGDLLHSLEAVKDIIGKNMKTSASLTSHSPPPPALASQVIIHQEPPLVNKTRRKLKRTFIPVYATEALSFTTLTSTPAAKNNYTLGILQQRTNDTLFGPHDSELFCLLSLLSDNAEL